MGIMFTKLFEVSPYSMVSDIEYMKAVDSGDVEAQRRMVDEAIIRSAPNASNKVILGYVDSYDSVISLTTTLWDSIKRYGGVTHASLGSEARMNWDRFVYHPQSGTLALHSTEKKTEIKNWLERKGYQIKRTGGWTIDVEEKKPLIEWVNAFMGWLEDKFPKPNNTRLHGQ